MSSKIPTRMDAFVRPYTLDVVIVRAVLVSGLSDMPLVNYPVKLYVSEDGVNWSLLGTWYTGAYGTVATTYTTGGKKLWFKAVFEGDADYDPSEDVAVWDPPVGPWVGCGTSLSLKAEDAGNVVRLTARLTDSNGSPLQNKRIWFRYHIEGTFAYILFAAAYTDANGYAVVEYGPDLSAPVFFEAVFVGDDQCDGAYASAYWKPNIASTYMYLSVRYDADRNVLVLNADLYNAVGGVLANRTIYFSESKDGSSWTEFGSAVTDALGRASITHNVESRLFFKAEFRGDDTYAPSSATVVWPVLRGRINLSLNIAV